MSREIKFRAWDTENKTWTFVTLGDLVCGACLSSGDKSLSGAQQIWEQSTGLKDKNGKEIYEGDILKIGGQRAVVIFDDEKGCYMGDFKVFWRGHVIQDRDYFHDFKDCREVIGNIHENPELWECMNGRD